MTSSKRHLIHTIVVIGVVAVATVGRALLDPLLGDALPYATYFVAVAIAAWVGGGGTALGATVLGWPIASHLFVPPRGSLAVLDGPQSVGALMYLMVTGTFVAFGDAMHRARHQAETSRESAHVTLSSIADGVISTDADGRVRLLNAVAERLSGWTTPEALGRRADDVFRLVDEDTRPMMSDLVRRAIGLRQAVQFAPHAELSSRTGERWAVDGSAAPVYRGDGSVDGAVVVFRDVTVRRQAESAIRDSEQRWRQTTEALPQLVWTAMPDGSVDYLGKQWVEYTGVPEAQHLGRAWQQAVHPRDRDRVHAEWAKAVAAGSQFDLESRLRRHDGEYRWFKVRAVGLRDDRGHITKWFGTHTDIDDQRQTERRNRQLVKELQDVDRRKDAFLATLAHELRGPLAPIRNSVAILDHADLPAPIAGVRDVIKRQLAVTTRLVDDLLDINRIKADRLELKLEPVDLAEALELAVDMARPLAEAAGHSLVVHMPAAPVDVVADRVRLAQAVSNLLTNACKYMKDGGRVELTARRAGTTVEISVRDWGEGIEEDDLSRVFDRSYHSPATSTRWAPGLGLGLSLVKALARRHGGDVRVTSGGLGEGSEFVLVLPAADAAESARDIVRRRSAPADLMVPGGQRILAVDDSVDNAETLATLLRIKGFDVQIASNGPAALELADEWSPHVVLLDLGMPGMDGFEVCRRLRERRPKGDLRIVALTGWGQSRDVERTAEAGFDDHLTKPVELPALLRSLTDSAF